MRCLSWEVCLSCKVTVISWFNRLLSLVPHEMSFFGVKIGKKLTIWWTKPPPTCVAHNRGWRHELWNVNTEVTVEPEIVARSLLWSRSGSTLYSADLWRRYLEPTSTPIYGDQQSVKWIIAWNVAVKWQAAVPPWRSCDISVSWETRISVRYRKYKTWWPHHWGLTGVLRTRSQHTWL